ncbi:MAG: hypothetical protein COT24_00990 [Candidatus Kerfeldbacteria bacterium CG08_land_8_20_14_0_20_40_16]|uniref:Uncharacterized protein n=1 Tax=Candidatus Kerfeldbacteria bacterium CG08_land_8_20_14_0_20_40_16 TaxID=2014244 RepID=A0A2H0YWN3_9BACT|nr:MAG: hypothetical protein COT24_00990 [Candidatus Kerfeldbacteria bacterium CG08_land_8_20_14_0_20_40_16]
MPFCWLPFVRPRWTSAGPLRVQKRTAVFYPFLRAIRYASGINWQNHDSLEFFFCQGIVSGHPLLDKGASWLFKMN